jgi:hypothetical protein
MDEAAAEAAGTGESRPALDTADGRAWADEQLAALVAEFGTGDFEFGYDREGWHGWSCWRWLDDLHAPTPDELRAKVRTAPLATAPYPPGVAVILAGHPGLSAWTDGEQWHCRHALSAGRFMTRGPVDPAGLPSALRLLAAAAAGCGRVEDARPGWLARVSGDGTWTAILQRGEDRTPLAARAPGEAALLTAIDKAAALTGTPS